jgi:glucose-1-phosphate thymidylyltransferase
MKGIILSGGTGSRLYPSTRIITKQLLPIYDKPMIYYPITTLILAGLTDLLIITTPAEKHLYQSLLGDGSQWGIRFTYTTQATAGGIAQAYILAEEFLQGEASCLILGDNILYGEGIIESLKKATALKTGAHIFTYYVNDPQRYGVIAFDDNKQVIDIIEKPTHYVSNYAVIGLYVFDGEAVALAKTLKPSARGEIEITDLNRIYLNKRTLRVETLGRGIAWLDTGTQESLLDAAHFVSTFEKRQALKIGCPEEAAWRGGLIDDAQLKQMGESMHKSDYGQYLLQLLERG